MRKAITGLSLLALVAACTGGAAPTTTTSTSPPFTLTPLGDTPEEIEAEFVHLVQEWSARQPNDPFGQGTDQALVDIGRSYCAAVERVEGIVDEGYRQVARSIMFEDN